MAEKCLLWIPNYRHRQWQPPVDVYRSPQGWLVKCDLAGVRREDIQVSLADRRLTISGARRDWSMERGYHVYSLEIAYTRFERTIELPFTLEDAEVRLDYRDGMLLIYLTTALPDNG
jgi:HSP20 family protein